MSTQLAMTMAQPTTSISLIWGRKHVMALVINDRTWTPNSVRECMLSSSKALLNALIKVYNMQTEVEKRADETNEYNGVGFNGTDGFILSKFAKQYMDKGWLSDKQMDIVRKKMPKYSRQIFQQMVEHFQDKINAQG